MELKSHEKKIKLFFLSFAAIMSISIERTGFENRLRIPPHPNPLPPADELYGVLEPAAGRPAGRGK